MSRCVRGSFLLVWLLLLPLLLSTPLTGSSSSSAAVQARSLDGADQRWRDWLLVEDTAPSEGVGSAAGSLVRRITPKSVFVAPNFNPGCKEGQQVDSQGKCVQIVRVDQAAHLDFLLKRFNSMFGAAPPPPSKKVEKDSPGPFHVSLPLGGAQETFKPQPEPPPKPSHSVTTTSPPQLTTTTTTPALTTTTTTTQKTETTTLTMPPATSFTTDATSELLNFSDESTTSRVTHETLKPSTFFTQASPTFLSSPTTTHVDETWSSHRIQTQPATTDLGSHRPQSSIDTFGSHTSEFESHRPQTLPTTQTDTFESQRPQYMFGSQTPHTDVFGSHRPQTLPTTQTDTFESQRPQYMFGSQTDVFGSHRPQTLPTTQTDIFGSHIPQTLPTTLTDVFESHKTQSFPTTLNTQNPDFLFEGVHRTRPSSLQTSTATAQTSEDSSDKTASFPSHTTLFTSPTLQTIQPFEGIHRTRPSSLHTTFPTVKTNEVFTLKGLQRTTPSSSQLSYTTTTSATTTFGDSTPGDDESPQESLIFSGDSDNKKPFVIIVANNTFKRQEPAIVTDETDYDSTTESTTTTLGSSVGFPESTTTTTVDVDDFGSATTTESSSDTRFGYFSSVLTPPPTVDTAEYSLEQFPAVEEVPSSSFDKDSLDVAASFQQMNDDSPVGSTRTKCDSTYEVSQVRDGRIISQSSVTNCQPSVKTTTPQPPLRTVAPITQNTNFRFPLESQTANRPSYIRFPEVPASATNYNTKLWANENNNNNNNNYGADSSNSKYQNSYFWPQQWNPYPSSVVRGWPIMDRSHISSNVYRKQYYQHPVPQWMNKNSNQYSWPVGRV